MERITFKFTIRKQCKQRRLKQPSFRLHIVSVYKTNLLVSGGGVLVSDDKTRILQQSFIKLFLLLVNGDTNVM